MPLDPYQYQIEGSEFLAKKSVALLAHEMGLGKTVMAIHGLDRILAKRALVVCPSIARINWQREFEMWGQIERSSKVIFNLSDTPDPNATNICSFDYASENYEKLKLNWDALIIDECHFLKSTDAKRTRAILGKNGIIRSSKRCWLLSGTPAPNHAGELWIMLYTFGATPLKYDAFVERYCNVRKTSYGLKISGTREEKIPELKQLLEKIMLRRLKKDVMKQLPPITFGNVIVEPGPVDVEFLPSFAHYLFPEDRRDDLFKEIKTQKALLQSVWDNMKPSYTDRVMTIDGISRSVSTLRRYTGLQKCQATIELVSKELSNNAYKKIVIFAIHTDVISTIRQGLREFDPVILFGKTDPVTRQKNIDRFQKNPKCRVMIANVHAAGTAITLTAAHHILFVEMDWVPGNNAQAIMRCHRIGQENPVSARFMAIDDSLDEKIMYVLKRKTKELTQIFD